MRLLLPVILFALLPACAWVQLEPAATQVKVLPLGGPVTGCKRLGEVEVSVKDRVGPYERNSLSVRDELESLARNEALTLQADSVQPLAEPSEGHQRWLAFRCGSAK
jgi:hypothetical protein